MPHVVGRGEKSVGPGGGLGKPLGSQRLIDSLWCLASSTDLLWQRCEEQEQDQSLLHRKIWQMGMAVLRLQQAAGSMVECGPCQLSVEPADLVQKE